MCETIFRQSAEVKEQIFTGDFPCLTASSGVSQFSGSSKDWATKSGFFFFCSVFLNEFFPMSTVRISLGHKPMFHIRHGYCTCFYKHIVQASHVFTYGRQSQERIFDWWFPIVSEEKLTHPNSSSIVKNGPGVESLGQKTASDKTSMLVSTGVSSTPTTTSEPPRISLSIPTASM